MDLCLLLKILEENMEMNKGISAASKLNQSKYGKLDLNLEK